MTRLAGLAMAGAIAFGAAPAWAVTWDMPTPYPDANFHTQNIMQFAEDVKQATGGKVEIKVHPGGSLFKHPEIPKAVRGGQVPVGEFLISSQSNENPIFGIDSIPFLATSYDASQKLMQAARPEIEKALDAQGMQVLYMVPWPPQGLYAKKPIESVDDLKGVKFRAYNPQTTRIAELAGAVPTQVEVPDIPQAFTTGRVEAMMTSPSTGANAKAWDFVSHYYDTQAWLPYNAVVVNKRAFRQLDEDTRKAILAAAEKAGQRGLEASKQENEAKKKVLADNGMKVQDPSPALKAGLEKIGDTMAEEWAANAGAAGKQVLEQYRK